MTLDRAVIERCLRAAHLARQTDRLVRRHQAVFWLFGGLWVNVSGRRQPRDGAARAEPGFPTKREVATEGGRRRHTMVVEALVPLDAARGATVYTNAPKRLQEAILANLCTLLRRHPGGEAHIAGAVAQPPTHTNSRSLCFLISFSPLMG